MPNFRLWYYLPNDRVLHTFDTVAPTIWSAEPVFYAEVVTECPQYAITVVKIEDLENLDNKRQGAIRVTKARKLKFRDGP
jgi:hypothetical protein